MNDVESHMAGRPDEVGRIAPATYWEPYLNGQTERQIENGQHPDALEFVDHVAHEARLKHVRVDQHDQQHQRCERYAQILNSILNFKQKIFNYFKKKS